MTDMRATERLLEVIATQTMMSLLARPDDHRLLKIEDAIAELRKRGDTLVRADDLRRILEEAMQDRGSVEQEFSITNGRAEEEADRESGYTDAFTRLENALGGKLR